MVSNAMCNGLFLKKKDQDELPFYSALTSLQKQQQHIYIWARKKTFLVLGQEDVHHFA